MSDGSESVSSPLRRGAIAGIAGTAAMTAGQTLYYRITGSEPSSTPAEVGKRLIRGVLHRDIDDEHTDALNNGMHWLYGISWGTLYGLAVRRPTSGIAFALTVWGASLIELPAMKLAPPVWETPPSAIAPDLGFHLLYGVAVAGTHRRLAPR